jgi:hypothetical protein
MQYKVALACTLVLLVLLRGPALMSAVWGNLGMLVLRDALLAQVDVAPGTYAVHGALRGDAAVARAMRRRPRMRWDRWREAQNATRCCTTMC